MLGFSLKGERKITLTESALVSLCKKFEEQFDIEKKKSSKNEIIYKLEGGINRMRWVNSGEITITRLEEDIHINYYISTLQTSITLLICGTMFFLYQTFVQKEIALGMVAFYMIVPLILLLSFISFIVFKLRINNSINYILSENPVITKEQMEWLSDPNKCPGCGCENVLNKNSCPLCGLRLK